MPEREPSAASLLRRSLAQAIAPAYARNPAVRAVFVAGSAARGHADRYSDLEVGVVWAAPPSEDDRLRAIAAADGDLVLLYPVDDEEPGPTWSDAWKIGRRGGAAFSGVEVDMTHCLEETVEQTLRQVLEELDADPMKQLAVGAILHALPLHGEQLVEGWRTGAAHYPRGLQVAVVSGHAQIEGLWRLDAFAARDNPVAGYRVLLEAQERLLHVLLGLNAVYYPGFKSLEAVVADLGIAPRELLPRLLACHPLVAGRSKAGLTALVEETYDLVERHLPEIDVERLRSILAYERPLWDGGDGS
jgi:hypothetical protein